MNEDPKASIFSAPLKDRVAYIQQPCWYSLDVFESKLDHLNFFYQLPDNPRPRCLLLIGESGMGKSCLLREFHSQHPSSRSKRTGKLRQPILHLEIPPVMVTPSGFMKSVFQAAGLFPARRGLPGMLKYFESMMSDVMPRMILIDEGQRIAHCDRSNTRDILEVIKWLGKTTQRPIVLSGVPHTSTIINNDAQLRRRFETATLEEWRCDNLFQQFVKSVFENLPLLDGYDQDLLTRKELLDAILKKTHGITGQILNLLQDAAVYSLQSGEERLTTAHLQYFLK